MHTDVSLHSVPPLVAIVGPTAVGKTACAIALAQAFGGECISADSRQIYQFMDIGTAKPSLAERAAVPHHLIDLEPPDAEFSLGRYQDLAMAAIADVTERKRLPILVGGTGQYMAAVLQGWQIPRVLPQPALRAALERRVADEGYLALHQELARIDPAAAAGIPPTNTRRVIRALEVYTVTGIPMSAQQTMSAPPYRVLTLWLTMDAPTLYARIDRRVDAMMDAGLLDEVQSLIARGYGWELPAMSSLGYREFQPYFAGEQTLAAAVERLKFNTHGFARRQTAWFRRLPGLVRLPALAPDLGAQAEAAIRSFLAVPSAE